MTSTPDPIGDFFSKISAEEEGPDPVGKTYPGSRHERRKPAPRPSQVVDWERWVQYKAVGGRRIELFPIGALAAALRRKPGSIRLWTRKGFLPKAPYRLPGYERADGTVMPGRRFYTRPMIESVVALFKERGLLQKDRVEWSHHPDLPGLIHSQWTALYEEATPSTEEN